MKRHIPNFLTCCNLLCGTLGILSLFDFPYMIEETGYEGVPETAYFVWAACIFDFFDGFAARALKVSSPIGKELDSLADVVSFGLLPSLFMFDSIRDSIRYGEYPMQHYDSFAFVPFVSFLIVVFSALRLAIFNVDETQKDSFRGLPTPANALFITGLPFIHFSTFNFLHAPWVLAVITVIFSMLLVSRIELFALKFKNFSWAENKIRFTFLILSVLLLVVFKLGAIPLIVILYMVVSLGAKAFAR